MGSVARSVYKQSVAATRGVWGASEKEFQTWLGGANWPGG